MAQDYYWSGESIPTKPKRGNSLLIILLLILGGLLAYLIYSSLGQVYVSKEDRFTVMFFSEPHTETQTVNDPYFGSVVHRYTTEHTATTYHCHVMVMDIPPGSQEKYGQDGLLYIAQGYILQSGFQVTTRDIVSEGITGRELRIETPNDGIAICRLFVVGDRIYRCLIANKDKTQMADPRVGKFLDSFHIVK